MVAIAILTLAPRRSVEGIAIHEVLLQRQSIVENYRYRQLVRHVFRGEAAALPGLVHAECGGGSGCYEHGEVLANILIRIGEADFIRMAENLKNEDRARLKSLLDAGFEYGSFMRHKPIDWGKDYPKLARMLEKS